MEIRNELIERYFPVVVSLITFYSKTKEKITEEDIFKAINEVCKGFIEFSPDIVLTEEEKNVLKNKINETYAIYQPEGAYIIGDYDHDIEWFENLKNDSSYDDYFWRRYKGYLLDNKKLSPNVVDRLENDTLKNLMSLIGNPSSNSYFSIRGLVVGDVQSGKTSNYIGLITMAADAGYKVIFVLAGLTENLRSQTQERIEEGFVGYDTIKEEDVGVGRGTKNVKIMTSRLSDFTGTKNENTSYKISDYSQEPLIFVIKKNANVLQKLYRSLKKLNTSAYNEIIQYSALIIDDEADNASINTNKAENDPTKINNWIRKLLKLFVKSSYVGFTATPFANVFIRYDSKKEMEDDDLFPRDFIYALETPSNYLGPNAYFTCENSNVSIISDYDDNIFPLNHKKDFYVNELFDSFYESINCFFLVNAIRDIRDIDKITNRSMLINISRFKNIHNEVKYLVDKYIKDLKINIKQCHGYSLDKAIDNKYIKLLYLTYEKNFKNIEILGKKDDFGIVFRNLYNATKDIYTIVVNSSKGNVKLEYPKGKSTRVIAIGGLALSRGLTLEGLCVSYFYRNSKTYDVLMQMGRWFGYRDEYKDLVRIFITKKSIEYYKTIYEATEKLKKDIRTMSLEKRKPIEYGIRVMNKSFELGITAKNKMRYTSSKYKIVSFDGRTFEAPIIDRDLNINNDNIDKTYDFLLSSCLSKIDKNVRVPYFRDISKEEVINFLLNISINGENIGFDKSQIIDNYLKKTKYEKIDVVIIGGESEKEIKINDLFVKMVARVFDLPKYQVIRISAIKDRLMGPTDARFGVSPKKLIGHKENNNNYYLIKDRNPILFIYFIDLKYPEELSFIEDDNDLEYKYDTNIVYAYKLKKDLENQKYNYLVSFAIGCPNEGNAKEVDSIKYVFNDTVNYYDFEHLEDDDD